MNDDFYKQVIKESPTGYAYHKIICNDDGIACDYEFLDVNAAFEKFTGLKESDIIGKRLTEIFSNASEAEFDWIKIYGDIAIRGGSKEIEEFSEKFQRWYKIKVYSPEKNYFITHFIDISKEIAQFAEINNVLSTVEESEFQYKALADYAYGWLTWEDAAGILQYVSPACERISGYTVKEFKENESLFASIIIEEDKDIWLNHRHEINHEKGAHTEHFRIRSKDHKIVWIEHTCRPAVDKNGINLGYRANNRDITERKRIENSLRESEELYRSILNASPDIITITDLQGRILMVSPVAVATLGCEREEELLEHLITDFIVPEDQDRASSDIALMFQGVMTGPSEYHGLRSDGSIFDIEVNADFIRGAEGQPSKIVFIVREITRRKQAEEETQKWANIFKNAKWGVTATNAESLGLELMNPAFAEMHGYTIEELRLGSVLEVSAPEVREGIPEKFRTVRNTGHLMYESSHIRKDGTVFPVSVDATAIRDESGKVLYSAINVQDITKQKKAESELLVANKELTYQNGEKEKRAAELIIAKEAAEAMSEQLEMTLRELEIKETEQKLSFRQIIKSQEEKVAILESMTDCFCAIDRDWQITYINCAGEIAFGRSRDELLSKKMTEIFEVSDTVQRHYNEVIEQNRPVTYEMLSKAIGNKWLEISAYPTESGVACYFRDITSRKIAEKELARLDRLNLVGQLAAGIAHEIRNPMTTVRGYLQLLGSKSDYVDQKSTFELMISEVDRANGIITEFLSLAQTKLSELKSQNINNIITHLYPLLEADTFTQNKQIYFFPGDIPNLELNEKEIFQLILNLARNGLEAMEENRSLTIKSYVEDCKVVLSIADEGCGILQENIVMLGIPFFTTKDTGTGLGLSSCYKIAEAHNAKIDIETSPSGTTFFILFPIPDKEQEQNEMIS